MLKRGGEGRQGEEGIIVLFCFNNFLTALECEKYELVMKIWEAMRTHNIVPNYSTIFNVIVSCSSLGLFISTYHVLKPTNTQALTQAQTYSSN